MKYDTANTNYVPATIAQPEAKPLPTHEGVSAQVQGNMAGAIGAAAIVIAAWLILHGFGNAIGFVTNAWPDVAQVAIGALVAWLTVFGALMFARNSLDEFKDGSKYVALGNYVRDLEAGIALRDEKNAALQVELNAAKAEVSALKSNKTSPQRYVPAIVTLGPEWQDAQQLVTRRYNGQSWGRDSMRDAGWNDARWNAAMDILYRAGVAVKSGKSWVPWDSAATLPMALAVVNKHRQDTVDVLRGSVANRSGDAVPDSDATSDSDDSGVG